MAADIASGADGVLRLGSVQGPGDRIYRLLGEVETIVPRLQVRLGRLPVADRLAAVRSGELDAALVRAVSTAPGLELLPVWSDPLYVALPAGHPLAGEPVLRLEQLGGLPLRLAARESNPPFHDLVTETFRASGTEPLLGPPFTDLQETLTAVSRRSRAWPCARWPSPPSRRRWRYGRGRPELRCDTCFRHSGTHALKHPAALNRRTV